MSFILLLWMTLLDFSEQSRIPALSPEMQAQFERAIEAQKKGDLDAAEERLRRLLKQGGKLVAVYNALGNVYQQKGEHGQALAAFGESERLNPADPIHHSLAGVSLIALGKSEEAVREFQQAVQMQPDNLLLREQLARAYFHSKDYPAAIDQYAELLKQKGDDPEYRYQLGRTYLTYSISCFQKIEMINPGSARLFQEAGDHYLAQGKLDSAIENYEKAREADPSIPEIHFLLGQFYFKRGETEKALQAAERALALTPRSPVALALRRSILEASKNPELRRQ
ncbi:MAG: tetratricopeptide repeat protein [Acidobacteria bacterium]|nr:tetratricopeptide repeat protein [Acidobacteriota bacterium]